MAQLNLILGTPGDNTTGEFVYESMAKIEANFNDLYLNKANKTEVLALAGGIMTGPIDMEDNNIFAQEVFFKAGGNNIMSILSAGTTRGVFEIYPPGESQNGINYDGAGAWSVGDNEIITSSTFASQTLAASNVTFASYLTITSATAQLAIQELKDEVDAVVASAGSGDMLKATYDTNDDGIVNDSSLLGGNTSAFHLDRTNHTGTQLAATISDFDTAVGASTAVTLNTAKVTNATHSGDATGDTVLTLASTGVTPGSYTNTNMTVDAKGRVTFAANGTATAITVDSTLINGSTNPVENNAIFDGLALKANLAGINTFSGASNIFTNYIRVGNSLVLDNNGSASTISGSAAIYVTGLTDMYFKTANNNTFHINTINLTAQRRYFLPNKEGTFAMLDDVAGVTNLSYNATPTNGTVVSDTGVNAFIPAGSTFNASLMLPGDKIKLDGLSAGAPVSSGTTVLTTEGFATTQKTGNFIWYKIGRVVTGNLVMTGLTGLVNATLRVTGLPFNVSVTGPNSSFYTDFILDTGSLARFPDRAQFVSNRIDLFFKTTFNGTAATITSGTMNGVGQLSLSITYLTD